MSSISINSLSILAQFRSFAYQNKILNFEKAVEYFSVFGGTGWFVDTAIPLEKLIASKILDNYRYIHGDITKITHSKPIYHAMLTAIATGDRREHSAFKKVNIGREKGEEIVDFIVKDGFLKFDQSVEKPIDEKDNISDKLLFSTPFMHFWFAVVSPTYKGIKKGEYFEAMKRWEGVRVEISALVYKQLFLALLDLGLKEEFEGDPIENMGSYYDKNIEIDILIKRKSGALIAGSFKNKKQKMGKSELTKLKENCMKAELSIDMFVLYSKNKFSSELKKEKGENVRLFSLRNLSKLMDNLSDEDMLEYTNKKY